MSELIKRCIAGCAKALWVPTIAAPCVYVATSFSTFSAFDLLASIPIGAAIGLLVLAVVGLPVLVALSYFQLNTAWLVSLAGLILGVAYGASVPVPTIAVTMLYGVVGAITGGVASHFASPNPSFKRDA